MIRILTGVKVRHAACLPLTMMSRHASATFAARAFARCRATYRDICLNRSDIRDWRARPRAARARRRSTSLTCRDICLESSDIRVSHAAAGAPLAAPLDVARHVATFA